MIYAPALETLLVDNVRKPSKPIIVRLDVPRLAAWCTQTCSCSGELHNLWGE
jgi:hypothetical protein